MSDAVYPLLPGLAWDVVRSPSFSTNVARSESGREFAVGRRLYPIWSWSLPYEVLRGGAVGELQQLVGFINQRRGRLDTWLYRDPNDYLAINQGFGTGDGVTTTFPLVRAYGGAVEPLPAVDLISNVRVNGVGAAYGVGAGQWRADQSAPNAQAVVFGSPPAPGAVLDWSGTYYWRCRFTNDTMDFQEFYKALHDTNGNTIDFYAPRTV